MNVTLHCRTRLHPRRCCLLGAFALSLAAGAHAATAHVATGHVATMDAATIDSAQQALLHGHADEAAAELQVLLAANPSNGPAHLLLCRNDYALGNVSGAVTECQSALAHGLGNSSQAQDWMGRVYGTKANSASPLKGFQLARKVKSAFESAEALDPHNADAANDLAEYYISAPAIVGGGLDKAAALADRIAATLPQSAHRTRALIAEKRGDTGTAEREFQAAAEHNAPAAWVDLGNFYARRNRPDEAVKALRHAVELDHAHDASLVDAATILASLHRETPLAEHALRAYLASDAQSDAAPAFAVYVSLGHLLESGGDPAAAREAYQQSLQLAHGYAPAMHALHGQEG